MGIETALLVASVGLQAGAVVEQRKARKAQRRAAKVQERRREIEFRRTQLQNIEEARIAIGSLQNQAAQGLGGGLDSSGVQGGVASLQSQLGSNLTFNQQLLEFTQRQEGFLEDANDALSRASTFQAAANLSNSLQGRI